jgi:hypothetical protein
MTAVLVSRPIFLRQDTGWAPGLITIFMPELEPDSKHGSWQCHIKIEWPGFLCEKRHLGMDAYQALELALRLVPGLIMATDDFRNRNLALWSSGNILDSANIRQFFDARILGDV